MTVTSGIAVRMAKETTFGTALTGSGVYTDLRLVSEDLSPNIEYAESAAIRSDGQIVDMIRTDAQSGGTIGFEMVNDATIHDELLQSVLLNADWSTYVTATTAATVNMSFKKATATVPIKIVLDGVSWNANFTVGSWILIEGTTNFNGIAKIANNATTTLHVVGFTPNPPADEDGLSGAGVKVTPLADIMNGVATPQGWTIERDDTDDSDTFHVFPGMSVTSWDLSVPTSGMITNSFSFEGGLMSTETTSRDSGTPVAAPTTSPMISGDVTHFFEGDPKLLNILTNGTTAGNWLEQPMRVLDFNLTVTPNLRQRKIVGTLGPAFAPARGDIGVTGSVRCYFNLDADGAASTRTNNALVDKMLNDTASGLAIAFKDANGDGYIIDLPRVQFTSVNTTTPGKSEDVIAEIDFQAYRNPDDVNGDTNISGTTIRIARGNF